MESDTLGDDPRVTAATRAPRDGTAPLRRTPSLRRSSRLWVPWLAGVAERVEVDLEVSGLKPDWPPRTATAGYRAGGRCPQDCAVAAGVGVTATAGRTPELLQARRRTSVRTNQNRPANRVFFLERPTIGGESSVSPTRRRRTSRLRTRKRPANAGLYEAAEGIRTLDLLHGKQSVWFPFGAHIPCKRKGSRTWVSFGDSPRFHASSRGFGHPIGTQTWPLIRGRTRPRALGEPFRADRLGLA